MAMAPSRPLGVGMGPRVVHTGPLVCASLSDENHLMHTLQAVRQRRRAKVLRAAGLHPTAGQAGATLEGLPAIAGRARAERRLVDEREMAAYDKERDRLAKRIAGLREQVECQKRKIAGATQESPGAPARSRSLLRHTPSETLLTTTPSLFRRVPSVQVEHVAACAAPTPPSPAPSAAPPCDSSTASEEEALLADDDPDALAIAPSIMTSARANSGHGTPFLSVGFDSAGPTPSGTEHSTPPGVPCNNSDSEMEGTAVAPPDAGASAGSEGGDLPRGGDVGRPNVDAETTRA
eukprot:TRINITY_DN3291_c0_g2_i1.p2 TRINITY_DN3291_c0_g2~~TRINITY_DN3291_c0_g2_i1.p2  ORF type:complete len:292 (+),score=29.00 TRINITY_DN3291_c0_g2_i1:373-1248(+)